MAKLAIQASEPLLKNLFLTLILFILFSTVSTGIISESSGTKSTIPQKCVSFCKEPSKYVFQPGTTYRYTYDTELQIFATGAPSQASRIHLTAEVELTPITSCELQLELKNVKFTESDPNNRQIPPSPLPNSVELASYLQQRPLRFSFQDGKVEHICGMDEDLIWVLNVKRGLLSALQNSMEDFDRSQTLQENDVSGKCFTRYEPSSESINQVIKRTKNFKSCSFRHSHNSAIQSVPYASNSPVQNIPLLSGTQECQQTIRNKQMERIDCKEEHKFQPFENVESGVKMVVTQSLVFDSSRTTTPGLKIETMEYRKSSLIFETQQVEEASDEDIRELMTLVESLEKESLPKVTAFAPEQFQELVSQLRTIKYPALKSLFDKAPSSTARSFLLDAMPLVNSAPSLIFMRELFSQGKLTELQTASWLTSISFIRHPRLEMISAIAPLLNGEPKNEALLSVASVIHAYCQDHVTCGEEIPIQNVLRKILSFLGPNCRFTNSQNQIRTRILFSLKAIGNAGRVEIDEKSFQLLQKCFQEQNNPIEIRLAAIEAFRRMPCDHYNHKSIIERYADMKENTEVRILSYLMAMKCPHRELIDTVKDTLYTDAVNQVGSFVWTHLTNLQETSSPDKQELKELLSNDFLKNKFNTDARKFSRNYESSMYWEDKNIGGGVDSNVIFTPDSFLPRSAGLNLTVFLFGESINLFEFGGRIHSFEQMLESIFGPEGYFPEPHVNEALNTVRSKRDVSSNQVERLSSVFNHAGLKRDSLPGGSLFMRIFGNEISYKNFEFSHKETAPTLIDENGRNWLDITYLFDNLGTGKNTEFTKSSVLIDSSYTVGTAVGIPLTLAVQSAATIGIKASGKIDLGNFWENQEIDVHGSLRPSAAIQVEGHLTLQLGKLSSKVKSGIKFQNTLHTATAVEARVLVKGTSVLHASLTLPEQKQEILEAKSQLVLVSPTQKYSQVIDQESHSQTSQISSPTNEICSPEMMSIILGLKVCGRTKIPENISFPLLSPASLSLSLEKTDSFNSYEFDYKWNGDEEGVHQDVSILFNTPGSITDRRLAISYSFNKNLGKIEGSIETPQKSLTAQGIYSKSSKNLQLLLSSRNEQILSVSTGLRQQVSRVEPHLLISYYSKSIIDAQGVIHLANILETDGKANFDMTVKHLTNSPIQLTGEVTRTNEDTYDGKIGIDSFLATGNIRSQIRLRPGQLSSKAEIQYSWKKSDLKVMTLSGKLQKYEKGGVLKYTAGATSSSTQLPNMNTDFSWEMSVVQGYGENNIKLIIGPNSWTSKTIFKNQFRRQQQDIQFLFSLLAPKNGIDYNFELSHQKNQSGLFTKFSGRLDSKNELVAQAHYLRSNDKLLKRNFNTEFTWPGKQYLLKSGVKEVRTGEYQAQALISSNGKNEKKIGLTYRNGSNKRRIDYALELRAHGFLVVPVITSFSFVTSERQSLITTEIQIEKGEGHSGGRWGGSFDYNTTKRFAHTVQAEVHINEKKYSTELNWRQAKSGDQIYTLDLQLLQHFYSELQVKKRMYESDIFWGILTIVPDKSFQNDEKAVFEMKLNSESGQLVIDYFGEPLNLSGTYSPGNIEIQAEWESKRLAFSLQTPSFTMEQLNMILKIETPLDGYKNIGFTLDHRNNGNSIQCRVEGHLEEKSSSFALYGNHASPQSTFSVMFDTTGMEKVSIVTKLTESASTKVLEVTMGKGAESSSLVMEITELQRALKLKIEFNGWDFIPEMSMEYNRLRTSEVTDTLVIEWKSKESLTQRIEGRVSYLVNPLKLSFLVTSPWKGYEKSEGHISLFQSEWNHELKIYINGPISICPLNMEFKFGGKLLEFEHSITASWYGVGTKSPISIEFLSTGRLESLDDGELKISAKIPQHNYQLEMFSRKITESGLKIDTSVVYDEQRIESNLEWNYKDMDNVQTTLSLSLPKKSKMIVTFEHVQTRDSYLLDFACGYEGPSMGRLKIKADYDDWEKWILSLDLNPRLAFIPIINFSSDHDIRNWRELRHVTVFQMEDPYKIWTDRGKYSGSMNWEITNEKKIKGSCSTTSHQIFELLGDFDFDEPIKSINIQTNGPIFSDYTIDSGFQGNWNGASTYFNVSLNETQLFNWNSNFIFENDSLLSGKLFLSSPCGHDVSAEGKFDLSQGLVELLVKEVKQKVIDLNLKAMIQETEGNLFFSLDGKGHPLLEKKSVQVKYIRSVGKIDLDGQYEDVGGKSSLSGLGVFTSPLKKLQLTMNGEKEFSYNFEILENSRLIGTVTHMGRKLFELSGEYETDMSDYNFGKHTIKLSFINGNTYNFETTLGLDSRKFLFNLQTPFESYKTLSFTGEVQIDGSVKSGIINFSKNSDIYLTKVNTKFLDGKGELNIEVTTPWKGYTKFGGSIELEKRKNFAQGIIKTYIETQEIIIRGNYSNSLIDIEVKTPYEIIQDVHFSTNWNMNNPSKSIQILFKFNDISQTLDITWDIRRTNGQGRITLTGSEVSSTEFKYNLIEGYSGEIQVEFGEIKYLIGGLVMIGPSGIRIELQTPLEVLKNFGFKGSYLQSKNGSHEVELEWNINGKIKSLTAMVAFNGETINFNTRMPLNSPWNMIEGKLTYQMDPNVKIISIQARRGDNENFDMGLSLKTKGKIYDIRGSGNGILKLNFQSLVKGWENLNLECTYNRTEEKHLGTIRLVNSKEILSTRVTMTMKEVRGHEMRLEADLTLEPFGIQNHLSMVVKLDMRGESSIKADLTHNGIDYSCEGLIQANTSGFKVEGNTSFSIVRKFLALGTFDSLSNVGLTLQFNEKIIEMKIQGAYDGLKHFKLNCDITTPFEGFRAIHGETQLTLQDHMNRGSISFQNDRVRYMGKFDGQLGLDSGELRIQFNSPLYKLEHIVSTIKYSSSKLLLSLERNTREEIKAEVSLHNGQLVIGLVSNLPTYPLNTRSLVDWGSSNTISLQMNLDGGPSDHVFNFLCKIEGIKVGTLKIGTPYKGYENMSLEWMFEGTQEEGMGRLAYNLPTYEKKSIRSSWKQKNLKNFEAEILWNENSGPDKGISGQYSWTSLKSGLVKFGGSVNYVHNDKAQALTFTMSIKRNEVAQASILDFSLKTPFPIMQELNLSGKISLDQEVVLDLSASLNQEKRIQISTTLFASPVTSRLKIIFNAPQLCDPFNLNAIYDLTTNDKHMEVFFAQNKHKLNVKAQAIVSKENPQEIELRMHVDSNIPTVTVSASASLRASYKIENDGTRQVTISVDSAQTGNWRLITSIRPKTDFNIKLRLDSPRPTVIPSVKSELGWLLKGQGLTGEFSHVMGVHEIRTRLTVSDEEFKITFNSAFPGLEDVLINGQLESGEGKVNKKLIVEVRIAGKRLTFNANILIPSKNVSAEVAISLVSSWAVMPNAAVEVSLAENGIISINGNWGERKVEVKGNFQRKKGLSLLEAAEADMTLSVDSHELITLQSHHVFHNNQISWNMTFGGDYSFASFLQQVGDRSVFSVAVKWSKEESLRVSGETNRGRFSASLSSPWASEMKVSGRYKISDEEYSADGFITYDSVRSGLRAELLTKNDSIAARMNVDVPILGQKLDVKIHLQMSDEKNIVGVLEMSMGDRQVSVKGSLATSHYHSIQYGGSLEQVLRMAISLPRSEYGEISSEWKIRRPVSNYYHIEVEGLLSFVGKNHNAAFRYDIPNSESKKIGFDWFIDSWVISREILKGSFEAENISIENLSAGLKYKENEIKISYKLAKEFHFDISLAIPNLFHESSPIRFQAEGIFDVPQEIVLRSFFSANRDLSTFEISMIQGDQGLNVRIFSDIPSVFTEEMEVLFKFNKIDQDRIVVDLSGSHGQESFTAIGEFIHEKELISLSLKVSGSYGPHFIQVIGGVKDGRYHMEVNGESLSLLKEKKIYVTGNFLSKVGGFEGNIECQTKQFIHKTTMVVNLQKQNGVVTLTIDSPYIGPLLLDAQYKLNSNKISTKIIANIIETHQFEFSLDTEEIEGKILILCPFLHYKPITAHVKGKTEKNNISLIGDLMFYNSRFRGEGTFKYESIKDMEGKFEIITPFKTFDRVTIGGKISEDVIEIEFKTPLKDLPNVMLKVGGIRLFDTNDLTNFHPKLIIGLPWVTYTAGGSFQVPSNKISGKFGFMYQEEHAQEEPLHYEAFLQLTPFERLSLDMDEPMEIKLEANSPIEGFRRLQSLIRGNLIWNRWADLRFETELNGRKISFLSQIRNESRNRKLNIDLITPFKSYEKFSFLGHIQNYEKIGAGHNIQLEFEFPGWVKPFVMETDYRFRYNDLFDMDGEFKVVTPTIEMAPIFLRIRSEGKDSKYMGILEGTWGDHRPIVKLDGVITSESLVGSIEAKMGQNNEYQFMSKIDILSSSTKFILSTEMMINYHQIFLLSTGITQEVNLIEGEVRLKTPFKILRSATTIYRFSPINQNEMNFQNILKNLDFAVGASYNDRKLIHIELVNRKGKRSIEINNPLRPISISFGYEMTAQKQISITAEVCWDLTKINESTVGFKFILDQEQKEGRALTFRIHGASNGFVEVGIVHLQTIRNFEQKLHLKWNQPLSHGEGEAGYSIFWRDISKSSMKMYDLKLRLDLPWRSIEIETHKTDGDKGSEESALLRWDVSHDPSKVLGGKLVSTKSVAWRSSSLKQILTLVHSGLVHELTFQLGRTYKNFVLQTLSFVFQPNSFPHDTFTAQFIRDSIQNKEIQFIMSHPATKIDFMGHMKQTDATRSFTLSHLDILGEKQTINLEVTSDINGFLVDIQTGTTPVVQFEYKPSLHQPKLILKSPSVEMSGDIFTGLPLLKGSIKYDHGRELSLVAGLPYSKEIILKLARNEFGMNIRDFLVSFKLNTSQILSTHVHWRPDTAQEFRRVMSEEFPTWIRKILHYHIPKVISILNDEVQERLTILDPSFSQYFSMIKEYSQEEITMITTEFTRVLDYVQSLHQKNTLYIKDMMEFFNSSVNKVYSMCSGSIESVQNFMNEVITRGRYWWDEVRRVWNDYGGQLQKMGMRIWEGGEKKLEYIWKKNCENFIKFLKKLGETYETIGQIMEGNIEELEKKFKTLGIVRKAKELYADYLNWIQELSMQEYIDEAYQIFIDKIWYPLELYYRPYFMVLNSAVEDGNLMAILEIPPIPYLRFASSRILQLTNRLWIFIEVEQKIKGLILNILSRVDSIIQRHIPTASMVWDLDKGHVEYHQPLSIIQWDNFKELPRFKETEEDSADAHQINEFYFDLLDTIRNSRPVLEFNMRDILPPFGATAIMAGDHHYLTFDQHYYRFAGECSYILVSDLLHQNLSLLVNYEMKEAESKKKSYSLVTGSKIIEIESDSLQVKLDGRGVDLPLTVGTTFLRRQPSGIEIIDTRGFQMKCSHSPSVCSITVSGWYFGKLGGLLGSYDNEPSNDMRTPDGTIVTEIENFAHSWRVGSKSGQCQMKNYAGKSVGGADGGVCNQIMNTPTSPLRPCFKVVDIEPFKKMCQHDVINGKNSTEQSVCTGVAAYVMQCQKQGVDLWMPPQCVECKLVDGTMITSGENVTYSNEHLHSPSSADVVFLIEEASSLNDYNLREVISKLEGALKTQGLNNNRYAVVGFGGKGGRATPHLTTSNNQIWSTDSTLKTPEPMVMDGSGNGDLYGAIEYAATIGYRAGVSKTMIAITAIQDGCGDIGRYSDALTLLLENDIRLHMLVPNDFSMKFEKKQETSRVIGIDMEGAFTIRQIKRGPIVGDRALRRQVKIPKDMCNPLAMETTGTLFNLKIIKLPAMAKNFLDVWSRRVASTSQPSNCQLCECLPNREGGAMTLCHPCVSPNLQKFIDDLNKLEQNLEFDPIEMNPN